MRIVKNSKEALLEARAEASSLKGPFRAPHHTVSDVGLLGELAIAAGGVLWLDSAELFQRTALAQMASIWAHMKPALRPDVIFALTDPEAVVSRPDQPKVKVPVRTLFAERIVGAESLSRTLWPEG